MRLCLSSKAGTRDHGYVAELDAQGDGEEEVVLDASNLRGLQPLCAVRLAFCAERLRAAGREVRLIEPFDTDVDRLANALLEPLVEHFDDVAVVRDAVLMAFSELCQNAATASPGYCARPLSQPRRRRRC